MAAPPAIGWLYREEEKTTAPDIDTVAMSGMPIFLITCCCGTLFDSGTELRPKHRGHTKKRAEKRPRQP
jgi:hypothetical protein